MTTLLPTQRGHTVSASTGTHRPYLASVAPRLEAPGGGAAVECATISRAVIGAHIGCGTAARTFKA